MNASLRSCLRRCGLSAAMTAAFACSPAEPAAPSGTSVVADFAHTVSSFGDWNGGLADTTTPPPVPLPQSVVTAADGDNWVCSNTQLEEKRNLDQLLVPGNDAGVLYPGALVQGRSLIEGTPAGIPLPRSPITISIDLGVEHASRRIDDPNSATVQAAVAELQREADSRIGPIDVVPARIDFEQTEAFSSDQFVTEFGGSVSASVPLKSLKIPLPGDASVGVNDSLGVQVSWQRHTIAVKLMQPMYTISFADEELPGPGAYLAPGVTEAQLQDVTERGILGPDNLPTYVKSVTYGRMVVFTLTNTSSAAAVEMEVAVQASLNLMKLGSGSGSSKLSSRDSLLLRNSELQVVAFGGSQDSALSAIRTGDLGKFFTAVPATQAVPLGYRLNYLKNGRVALLGVGTRYTRSDCTPAAGSQGRYWHIRLVSLTSNGGCDSTDYIRRSWAWILAGTTVVKYPLLDVESGPMADTTVDKEIVLRLSTATGDEGPVSTFTLESEFYPGRSASTCGGSSLLYLCQRERDFRGTDQFAVNPYVFSDIITLYGPNSSCTVTFTYRIPLAPALSPPAQTAQPRAARAPARTAGLDTLMRPPWVG